MRRRFSELPAETTCRLDCMVRAAPPSSDSASQKSSEVALGFRVSLGFRVFRRFKVVRAVRSPFQETIWASDCLTDFQSACFGLVRGGLRMAFEAFPGSPCYTYTYISISIYIYMSISFSISIYIYIYIYLGAIATWFYGLVRAWG